MLESGAAATEPDELRRLAGVSVQTSLAAGSARTPETDPFCALRGFDDRFFCVACILVLIMILSLEHVLSNTRTFSGFCCEGCVHGWFAKKSLQKPFCSEHLISPQRPTFFSDIPWTGDYKKELTVFLQGSGKPNNRRFEVHGFAFPRLLELSGGGPTSCSTLNTLNLQG